MELGDRGFKGWQITIDGLVAKPMKVDVRDLINMVHIGERGLGRAKPGRPEARLAQTTSQRRMHPVMHPVHARMCPACPAPILPRPLPHASSSPPEERVYRHRCVEAWSIVVPWIGCAGGGGVVGGGGRGRGRCSAELRCPGLQPSRFVVSACRCTLAAS